MVEANSGGTEPVVRLRDREFSGRAVVTTMFLFALTIIALLFTYWHFYTKPFHNLQVAIAERIPGSSPRAVGGKHKSHKADSQPTLRIIVRVPFDPSAEPAKSELYGRILAQLAETYHGLSPYEMLQIRLLHRVPEKDWETIELLRPVKEWRQQLASDPPPDRPPPETSAPR